MRKDTEPQSSKALNVAFGGFLSQLLCSLRPEQTKGAATTFQSHSDLSTSDCLFVFIGVGTPIKSSEAYTASSRGPELNRSHYPRDFIRGTAIYAAANAKA